MATPSAPAAQSWAEHLRATWVLGVPLVGSNLAQFAINLTDSIMLGWYDVRALAAVTLAGSLHFLLFILGAGFGHAITPMIAAAEETGDHRQARRVTRMALWLIIGFSLIVAPFYLFSGTILVGLGQEPALAADAQTYLRIIWFALPVALSVVVLRSYLSAVEHTRVILVSTIGAALLNAVMNWGLIFGNLGLPEWGIRGSATASVLTVTLSLLWLIWHILRRLPEQEMFVRFWRRDDAAMGAVFRLGLPIGLTSVAEGGMFVASNIMAGWIGTVELATHGIALQLAALFFMMHLGLSQAATVRAGRAYGRKDGTALRRGAAIALALSAVGVAVTVAAFLSIPGLLIQLFVSPDEPNLPQILALGTTLLAVAALFQLVDAAQVMALGLLRGVQDTRVPMWISGLAYWAIGLTSAYVLAFVVGLQTVGLWLGLSVGLGAAAAMLSWRFWRGPAQRF